MMGNLSQVLPKRIDTEIPEQVCLLLSLCETAVSWYDYGQRHQNEVQDNFYRGVVDYWWSVDLEEPSFDQLFQRGLFDDDPDGWPTVQAFAYQQGAIVGYRLREQYG